MEQELKVYEKEFGPLVYNEDDIAALADITSELDDK